MAVQTASLAGLHEPLLHSMLGALSTPDVLRLSAANRGFRSQLYRTDSLSAHICMTPPPARGSGRKPPDASPQEPSASDQQNSSCSAAAACTKCCSFGHFLAAGGASIVKSLTVTLPPTAQPPICIPEMPELLAEGCRYPIPCNVITH